MAYKITNYGNTRKLPYKGEYYELTKHESIETDDKELADTLGAYEFIDVEVIDRPIKKRKYVKRKKRKTKIRN